MPCIMYSIIRSGHAASGQIRCIAKPLPLIRGRITAAMDTEDNTDDEITPPI